jgi:hypothetical protein
MEEAAPQFVYCLKYLLALRRKHENLGQDGPNPPEYTTELLSTLHDFLGKQRLFISTAFTLWSSSWQRRVLTTTLIYMNCKFHCRCQGSDGQSPASHSVGAASHPSQSIEIYCGQSTSVFPCQYHSINAPYSSSSTRCSYQTNKQARPGNLPQSDTLSEIGQH